MSETDFQALLAKTSNEKQARIRKFFRREDAIRCLFADLLIRHVLMQDFGLKTEEIAFTHSPYGKPSVAGCPDIYFNVSHSGDWVVCAVDNAPVGIDIEVIKLVDLQIANIYFSKSEKEQLFSKSLLDQLPFFFELWTLKESYIKQQGQGLSIPLDAFSIGFDKEGLPILKTDLASGPVRFRQLNIDSEYKLAVCGVEAADEDVTLVSTKTMSMSFVYAG